MSNSLNAIIITLAHNVHFQMFTEKLRFYAIACSEAFDSHVQQSDWQKGFTQDTSRAIGAGPFLAANAWSAGDGSAMCGVWPARAKQVYRGPWNKPTANSIMVIGNKFDPSTPMANSYSMALDELASARLVRTDWVGHASLSQQFTGGGDCLYSYIAGYLINSTLPPFDAACNVYKWFT